MCTAYNTIAVVGVEVSNSLESIFQIKSNIELESTKEKYFESITNM